MRLDSLCARSRTGRAWWAGGEAQNLETAQRVIYSGPPFGICG